MAPPPATFETFAQTLGELVARFDRDHPQFTSPDYNEAALRADFLDPFFRALGWDVGNTKGLIHTQREVDIEVTTAISGRQTRADYVFRLGRTEHFTCEAKKPAEQLHLRHCYQAKRDAFYRNIPVAILSDFAETKIFIVGSRPHRDEPHVGEYRSLHFRQYPAAARELWDLLACEQVAAGSIDRLIESLPKRALTVRGRQAWLIRPDRTRSPDAEFLNFLDEARRALGSDLLRHNDRADLLSGNRLNEAAQRILDRLVFLRICEDRSIDTGQLLQSLFEGWCRQQKNPPKLRRLAGQARLGLGPEAGAVEEEPPAAGYGARGPAAEGGLYREITWHFRALDQRPPSFKPFFNGQLFKPHFSEELVVGDEWLANFIDDLTEDDSGYNFADFKVEILGDAYERFLGKVLRPQGRGVTIEEKPEVRKAGGVYYTPRHITDYIVEQTIGRVLAGKPPAQVAQLRFLDPACGSGSFLLRAYERVMEHYLQWFTTHPAQRRKADCYLDAAGNVRLTTALKRRILRENIHGVDIDGQAVEVAQLSLYLKMLEGENRATLHAQSELFRGEPLLPPLNQNIKCFNSLIASDFSLDPAELVRVNAGDWDVQFPAIMQAGGFAAIVGNPPYGRLLDREGEKYWAEKLAGFGSLPDVYAAFIERSFGLLRPGGLVSMIVPSAWIGGVAAQPLRRRLLERSVEQIIALPFDVFPDAYIDTAIFVARNQPPEPAGQALCFSYPKKAKLAQQGLKGIQFEAVPYRLWLNSPDAKFVLSAGISELLARLRGEFADRIGSLAEMRRGVLFKPDLLTAKKTAPNSHRYFEGDVWRYDLNYEAPRWVEYGPKMAEWPKEFRWFEGPRVLLRRLVNRQQQLMAAFEERALITNKNLYALLPRTAPASAAELAHVLVALLNSRLLARLYLGSITQATKDDFPQVTIQDILALPVPTLTAVQRRRLAAFAQKMLTLTPRLREAKADKERHAIENALAATDRQINAFVYELYGLTPKEIALVESSASSPATPLAI